MGYLQTLQLMVRAYKAARGAMPKGLDLLKLKMKARQKVIDSKKVIEFPKDRITNPFKPRPEPYNKLINPKSDTGIKLGKVREGLKKRETEAEMLARMKRQNKEAVQRLKEKKKPRDDKATGGLANISQTYDNNPTLQSQFPNKQDYLDLFSSTTTTTPQTQTYAQMTQQQPAAGIPAIKPIVPIIPLGQEGDGGGGGPGPKGFDKGYSSANFGLGPNKDVVDYEAEAYGVGRTPLGTMSGIITSIPSLSKTAFQFVKKAGESLADRFRKSADAKRLADRIAAEQEKARLADELAKQMNAVYYDNPGADFTGGRYDGASSRSEYESNPTGFSGSS